MQGRANTTFDKPAPCGATIMSWACTQSACSAGAFCSKSTSSAPTNAAKALPWSHFRFLTEGRLRTPTRGFLEGSA